MYVAHETATIKHMVLSCKIDINGTCGVQGMWMRAKQKMLQIWKFFQNSELHVDFGLENDPKHSREAYRRVGNAQTLLRRHKHVIQSG